MNLQEEKESKKNPLRWYWSQPEAGRTVEDCETIVRECGCEKREDGRFNLHVLFV